MKRFTDRCSLSLHPVTISGGRGKLAVRPTTRPDLDDVAGRDFAILPQRRQAPRVIWVTTLRQTDSPAG